MQNKDVVSSETLRYGLNEPIQSPKRRHKEPEKCHFL